MRTLTRLSADERTRIVRLYGTDGHSIREVAALTHRSYGAVHRVLSEAGVALRPRGRTAD